MIFHFSQQKHVALSINYNTKLTQHKHTIQSKHNQTTQTKRKGWFNILDLLRFCDKRNMAKGWWLARYRFESLDGKVNDLRELNYPRYK
jgi:hypothetical protein